MGSGKRHGYQSGPKHRAPNTQQQTTEEEEQTTTQTTLQRLGWKVLVTVAVIVAVVGYYLQQQQGGGVVGFVVPDGVKIINDENWITFSKWLHDNGCPQMNLQLAEFADTGRGVMCTKSIKEKETVVKIQRNLMVYANQFSDTPLAHALHGAEVQIDPDHKELAFYLLYQVHQNNSFWQPYFNMLPKAYPSNPLFFTQEEASYLDGQAKEIYDNQLGDVKLLRSILDRIEAYNGLLRSADYSEYEIRRALVTVYSRAWSIGGLAASVLVPLADMLNHNPTKGTTLDYTNEVASITANVACCNGCQFFDKYYGQKIDTESMYFMTYGFLLFESDNTVVLQMMHSFSTSPQHVLPILQNRCQGIGLLTHLPTGQSFFDDTFIHCIRLAQLTPEEAQRAKEIFEDIAKKDKKKKGNLPSLDADDAKLRDFVGGNWNKQTGYTLQNEELAKSAVREVIQRKLNSYSTTIEEDEKILKTATLTNNSRNAVKLRLKEKVVLHSAMKFWQ